MYVGGFKLLALYIRNMHIALYWCFGVELFSPIDYHRLGEIPMSIKRNVGQMLRGPFI